MGKIVGIDPGTNTGFAVWDTDKQSFDTVESKKIHEALSSVKFLLVSGEIKLVVFEDARLRSWFGRKGKESLQGAGSIKRDCSIWADYLGDLGVAYKAVKPTVGMTKWDHAQFAKSTGYQGRTNEHGRDAALLVWGMK